MLYVGISFPLMQYLSTLHQYRIGNDLLKMCSAVEDLRVLVDNKLTISQQCAVVAKKANGILRCIKKCVQQVEEDHFPPPSLPRCDYTWSTAFSSLGSFLNWAPQFKNERGN